MAEIQEKLCQNEIAVISPACRERFLSLSSPELGLLADSGVTFSGASRLRPRYEIRRQIPRWHTLLYTVSGEGRLNTEGKTHRLAAGTLWIGPANISHHYGIIGSSWELSWVCVAPGNRFHFEPARHYVLHGSCASEVTHTIRSIVRESDEHGAEHSLMMETYARLLHLLLKRDMQACHLSTGGTQQRALENVWRQVRDKPGQPWTLENLTETSGLNIGRERFRQLCVAHFAKTPLKVVTEIRMEIARELLSATDYCVYTVANMVGYQNEYAFTAAFHRATNCPPTVYRKRSQARRI